MSSAPKDLEREVAVISDTVFSFQWVRCVVRKENSIGLFLIDLEDRLLRFWLLISTDI